jgi:hypothetical protein
MLFNHGIGALLKYLTIGYQFKMAARHVLSVMPPVQNRKPARVFRAIELRANFKPAIANDFKLYETNRGKGSTNGRGAILLYKHCS